MDEQVWYTADRFDILWYISRWRGTVRLNDDSNSRRRTLNASRVNLNPIYVRRGQSARDDKSHIRMPRAECAWRLIGYGFMYRLAPKIAQVLHKAAGRRDDKPKCITGRHRLRSQCHKTWAILLLAGAILLKVHVWSTLSESNETREGDVGSRGVPWEGFVRGKGRSITSTY